MKAAPRRRRWPRSSVDEAPRNLVEAIELFFETADPFKTQRRLQGEVFITRLEVNVG